MGGAYYSIMFTLLLVVACLLSTTTTAFAASGTESVKAHYLPEETAERFGELNIQYNGRICSMQTFAIDFTKKLYGDKTYKGLTAEQVVTGWIFWGEEWMNEPMLQMESSEMKATKPLPDYVSANAYNKSHAKMPTADDKIELLMNLRRGLLLKIFPYNIQDTIKWLAPTEDMPKAMDYKQQQFIQTVFTLLYDNAEAKKYKQMDEIVGVMQKFQTDNGGLSLPTARQMAAERMCNNIPFATILFITCLAIGFPMFIYTVSRLSRQCRLENNRDVRAGKRSFTDNIVTWTMRVVMLAIFATLSYCEYQQYALSGNMPIGDNYELMLFVAWTAVLVSLVLSFKFRILLTCGFLVSGVFLLACHIIQTAPETVQAIHTSLPMLPGIQMAAFMAGFAMLSLIFANGFIAFVVRCINRDATSIMLTLKQQSLYLFYPAMVAFGIGILTKLVILLS